MVAMTHKARWAAGEGGAAGGGSPTLRRCSSSMYVSPLGLCWVKARNTKAQKPLGQYRQHVAFHVSSLYA